jgi:translation initiation factor 6 (eIF-6)
VVDPRLKKRRLKNLKYGEAITEIAGLPYVAFGYSHQQGVLAHPMLTAEKENLENVPSSDDGVSCGVPYVGTGLLANSHAAWLVL